MINLNTRSRCDACGLPAKFETKAGVFLCGPCAVTWTEFSLTPIPQVPAEPGNAPTAPSSAPNPQVPAVGAHNSVSDGVPASSLLAEMGPSATRGFAPSGFNSGDGLGNLEPGSHTCGGGIAAPAASGRARDRAISPAVAGIPTPNPAPLSPGLPASANCAPVPAISAGAPLSSALDFEAEVTALETEWLERGIVMNATTFFIAAASDIAEQSKSVSVGA